MFDAISNYDSLNRVISLNRHKVGKKVLEIVAKSNPDTILDITGTEI
jgi:ubiquinone/menaquinone biosynthesis C-methylase UbiE